MFDYAVQDVKYLPELYKRQIKQFMDIITNGTSEDITMNKGKIQQVFYESSIAIEYASINRQISFENLTPNFKLVALVKNFQAVGAFCSLNIGTSALVSETKSLIFLQKYANIGDILYLEVSR
jgi:hypothetical protein